ncbi:Replication factor-A carboxy-terminal domain protein [Rhynchospora pubera]|uniref:Replication factor-A carboxy-terminal domain protein n=1 Tax=Rhynchospora pubera TaxID=906938 RepID=A0AAV8GXE1_9POAL|nr:Replication factor-A carboxy-terminal domain protein [Rhynchospora pubera]
MVKGRPTRIQTIYLTDERGHTVDIVLWEDFIDAINIEELQANSNEMPIIVACSSVMLKEYEGTYSLKTFAGTRFYTDYNIEEIKKYLTSAKSDSLSGKIERRSSSTNDVISANPLARNVHIPTITLEALSSLPLDNSSGGQFICIAEIVHINKPFDWFYDGCVKCNSRMKQTNWCPGCKENNVELIPCYKLCLEVKDNTGEAEFKVLTTTAEHMVGMEANKVIEGMNGNEHDAPEPIRKLVGKIFKFTVSGKLSVIYNEHRSYTVMKAEMIQVQDVQGSPSSVHETEEDTDKQHNGNNSVIVDYMDESKDESTITKEIKKEPSDIASIDVDKPNINNRVTRGKRSVTNIPAEHSGFLMLQVTALVPYQEKGEDFFWKITHLERKKVNWTLD